jgi:hypothetical protein
MTIPSAVAHVSFPNQSGPIADTLLANPETGDYVLNDYLELITPDPAASIVYTLSYADDNGIQEFGGRIPIGSAPCMTSAAIITQGVNLHIGAVCPQTIHAVKGTPIAISVTITGTPTILQYSYHAVLMRLS